MSNELRVYMILENNSYQIIRVFSKTTDFEIEYLDRILFTGNSIAEVIEKFNKGITFQKELEGFIYKNLNTK